jgi:filamentous hemagglutinin family protein
MKSKNSHSITVYLAILLLTGVNLLILSVKSIKAQITSDNTTGTIVNQNNNQFDITGGIVSGDGANLFHSFAQFGLTSSEIANFLSNPNINNILGRITGGDPSYINGLIQLTGGSSNLYLMNPAGIIFGNGSSLNIPADFTATTATGILFNNEYFNAIGDNNYSNLIGNPTGFVFNTDQPGVILNTGNLTLNDGGNLILLGGTVTNTGNLTANEGNITLASVTGNSKVTLSQPGQILNLEINIPSELLGNKINITPLDLPELLTGNTSLNITDLIVNSDGTISTQTGKIIPTDTGTTIVTGNIDASSNTTTGGNIYILGNTVGLLDEANINVSGLTGGGNIYIGGEYQGQGLTPTALQTYISQDSILNASALNQGDGGTIIVWADQTTQFYGTALATGGILGGNGGFIEISGKENLAFNGTVDVSAINGNNGTILFDPRNIIIVAGVGANDGEVADGQVLFNDGGLTDFTISAGALTTLTGNILLQATNDIIAQAGTVLSFINQTSGENITFTAGNNITINTNITTGGGDIILTAGNSIVTGNLTTSLSANYTAQGGDITLTAGGAIQTGNLNSSASATAI